MNTITEEVDDEWIYISKRDTKTSSNALIKKEKKNNNSKKTVKKEEDKKISKKSSEDNNIKDTKKNSNFLYDTKKKETTQSDGMIWFTVDHEVSLGKKLVYLSHDALRMAWKAHGKLQYFSPQPDHMVRTFTKQNNLLAEAVHQSFYKHFPLILSPDIIWLTITQGLSNHIAQDPEGMRKHFVDFKGKKNITISREDFIKDNPNNDWTTVFSEVTEKISIFIGKETVSMMTCNFTTSGINEQIVSTITLMDAVQHYFEYSVVCGCGIPSIGLRGTLDDWKQIRSKAETLKKYELEWWLKELLPVLDEFIKVMEGKPDKKFWRAICNYRGASGMNGDPITGWLQVFFPYLNASKAFDFDNLDLDNEYELENLRIQLHTKSKMKQNLSGISQYHESYTSGVTAATYERGGMGDTGCGNGIKLADIPPSMSSAAFTYIDFLTKKKSNMAFMGGIVSLIQHPKTRALEPVVGWAVIENPK